MYAWITSAVIFLTRWIVLTMQAIVPQRSGIEQLYNLNS